MHKAFKVILIILAILVGLVALVYLISLLLNKPIAQEEWYKPRVGEHNPLILAHQAGEGEYPSNSRIGFEAAVAIGADVLDADVHLTKDGEFVLFHDETLEHRTNGTGAIRDRTLAELRELDFAYNWSPDGGATYPYRGQGITVMTAKDLFENFPDIRLGVEIKQVTEQAARDFCGLIKQYNAESRTLVASVGQDNIDAFREECPEVATSATERETTVFYVLHRLKLTGLARVSYSSFQVPEFAGGVRVLTDDFVAAAHKRGLKVYAWTIDTPEQAQHFMDMGVDGVNTSYPKRIIDWLNTD